ncbi:MAG: fused MFS/spermidine synthase [Vicinamibacteria bacterium]
MSRAPSKAVLALCFIGSGFTAVSYQVLLSRYVQLVVGSTAYAVSAILVAFLLGSSIGALAGGRAADRVRHPLRLYAIAEVAIGLYCLAFPALFPLLEEVYVRAAPVLGVASLAERNAFRFAVGVLAFVVPALLMGVTTPAFARAAASGDTGRGQWLVRVYGWNTGGAALGAFATAYLFVPTLGFEGTMTAGAVLNLAIGVLAWVRSEPVEPAGADAVPTPMAAPAAGPRAAGWILLLIAAGTGFLSFALEVIWTHLLAILLGNSVYAFGLMLGSLLLGLATGTLIAFRVAARRAHSSAAIGVSLVLAGLAVTSTLGVWDDVPQIFLLLARASPSFAFMEFVRFLVAFLLMVLPTALLGTSFPLILRAAAEDTERLGTRVGAVYSANTVGAIGGALFAPYVLLGTLGSARSLQLLGALLLALGVATLGLAAFRFRAAVVALAGSVLVWSALAPAAWNFNTLSTAAAVYLGTSASSQGQIVFQREDPTGGLTTVVEDKGVRTLLTNGKFQGDDSEEVPIQHRAADIPALFTAGRERALVIGLGTGVTLASLAAHGFERVDCAEISNPIVDAARTQFAGVNGGVLDWPHVRLLREDGRSVLVESPQRYDVVSVEISSIWFAGVGAIYSQEFYALARNRLREGGVLLQWFPIHHLSPRNLYVVVNTARSVFPHVSVWTHRHQAFVLASNRPLAVDLEALRADQARTQLQPYLRELDSGSPLELLSDLVVTDREVDGFLDAMARLLQSDRSLVSTDSWPTIEYETPKDILAHFSYFQNRAIFRRFRSRTPFPFRGSPTPEERALARAAHVRGWMDARAVPRLAETWQQAPALSAVAARWLQDELAESQPDDEAFLGAAAAGLPFAAFAPAAGGTRCQDLGEAFAADDRVELEVEAAHGLGQPPSAAEAAIDGNASSELGLGWAVTAEGRPPSLDLRLRTPQPVKALNVRVTGADSTVRLRALVRDTAGRWHPLAAGGTRGAPCTGTRVIPVASTEPIAAVRIEIAGEAQSTKLALHEVWVTGR